MYKTFYTPDCRLEDKLNEYARRGYKFVSMMQITPHTLMVIMYREDIK